MGNPKESLGLGLRLLRQWASGKIIPTYRLSTQRWSEGTIKTQGMRRHYVPLGSEETEARWQEIENAAGPLLAACGHRDSTFTGREQRALADLVALHFVRSDFAKSSYLLVYERVMTGDATGLSMAELPKVERYLNSRSRWTYPVGSPKSQHRARLWFTSALRTAYSWQSRFGEMLVGQLDRVRQHIDRLDVSILNPENDQDEFIISDAPVVLIDDETHQRVFSIDSRTMLFMPVSPNAVLAIAPQRARWLLQESDVHLACPLILVPRSVGVLIAPMGQGQHHHDETTQAAFS